MIDLNSVGQDKPYEDATKAYDAKMGTYKDVINDQPLEGARLPTTQLPKGPDPMPFKLGPMTSGG